MAIESDSLALQTAEYGSSTTMESIPSYFRHPNGDIVHEIQLGTGLKQEQKLIGDDDGTAENLVVLQMKEDSPKDVPGTDISNTEQFQLPQSSYCLLISADICSFPFNTGILALGLSLMCLICVLCYTLGNPLMSGIAETEVIIAKYVAVLIGKALNSNVLFDINPIYLLLILTGCSFALTFSRSCTDGRWCVTFIHMIEFLSIKSCHTYDYHSIECETEIPTGIELIGKGAVQVLSGGRRKLSMKRIVFSSMIRLTVGYMFLTNAFLLIVQQMTVLPMFLGVLGLLFVERIDEAIFTVSKRGEMHGTSYS